MEDTIPFATYFVERLKQCGVKYVQGVPGDYNLELVSLLLLGMGCFPSMKDEDLKKEDGLYESR